MKNIRSAHEWKLYIREAGGWRGFYVLYNNGLISARVTHTKNRYKFPQVIFTRVPFSSKTPTTGIFGNKLPVCIWCPTSILHLEILAMPPSQMLSTGLTQKNFPYAHKAYSCPAVTWIWMTDLCKLRCARKDLTVVMEQSVFSYLIKLIWKGIFIDRIRLLLIWQIGNGSIYLITEGLLDRI